ncbi:MAG TPA: protein kinase [Gemmataceae bacterium]|jgi:serine/threonine protein kinase|nr:protein kinase [Gemmataceae bacterium]
MPAPSTVDEFLQLVRKSGVVEDKRLDACLLKLRAAGGAPADAGQLAGLMVRDGILTQFQAQQFLLGKWKGFTIGKYKVLERLGSGGMGSVYLCEHKFMRRRTAVKVLPTAKADDPASLERFYREARAVAALDHPNIVRAYDIDQEGKLHFLVMEYVDGSSLQEIIKKHGPMDITRAAHYIRQAAVGLQHAHHVARLVHRDVKPGNVLVDRHGVVKVLDMGLARFFLDEEDVLTKKYDEAVLGTADYLAPEQAIDSHDVDIRADIYSLGATFYFLLTGATPFNEGTVAQKLIWHQTRQPKPIRTLRPEVPTELAAVLDKMMAKEPGQRYQTPAEVIEALAPWTQQPIPPPPEQEMPHLSLAAQGPPGSHSDPNLLGPSSGGSGGRAAPSSHSRSGQGSNAPAPGRTSGMTPPPAVQAKGSPAAAGPGSFGRPSANGILDTRPVAAQPGQTAVEDRPPQARDRAAAPAREEDSLPWGKVTRSRAEEPTARIAAQPQVARKTATAPAALARKRRLWWILGAGGFIAVTGLVTVISLATSHPSPRGEDSAHDRHRTLKVSAAGGADSFRTVREALGKAQPGDHIAVLDDRLKEQLILSDSETGKGVTIESGRPGKPVQWLCPSDAAGGKFVQVANTEGVHIKGFRLDGGQHVDDLVTVSGQCPGLVLEDLQLEGFKRAAVAAWDASGSRDDGVITLTRLRVIGTPGQKADAAIRFGTHGLLNEHWLVRECRFEGPTTAAVWIAAHVEKVEFRRNRFFQTGVGFLYEEENPVYPLQLTLRSNTFYGLDAGLHFMIMPLPEDNSSVLLKANLFSKTGQVVRADKLPDEGTMAKLFQNAEANYRDKESQDDNELTKKVNVVGLPVDVDQDATFLRYPKENPLGHFGPDKTPVGVPRE